MKEKIYIPIRINETILTDEIAKKIIQNKGKKVLLQIVDEDFTSIDIKKQEEILDKINKILKEYKAFGIKVMSTPDSIDKNNLKLLKKYKVKEIELIIESSNDYILKNIGVDYKFEEVKKVAKEVGYPIMLKALAGGGGKGMRLVRTEEEVETALRLSQSEAGTSFGNDAVYIEKYIENPHHIEVQIMGDKYGNVVHLGERECSIQRRNQKVIEESPSPFVKEETRKKMLKVAVEACKRIGYYSAGTLEFMMDKDQNFYFLEMNTRLQVEHPVTEECTGVDLVRDMIMVAAGNPLPYKQEDIKFSGAAIECRIYAEDPENNFMPSPGVITVREAPEGRNLRLDSAAYAGFEVSLHYDPMIAKLCCWGRTRESAISNMARALREYKILGIKTTIPFHQRVLKNAAFLEGKYDTTFIDTRFDKEDLKRRQNTDPTVAVIAAAVRHYEREKEAASRATTLPVVGESLWKYYGKLQMTANNY